MAEPATTGVLRTNVSEMKIGDYIACKFVARPGDAGVFSDLGETVDLEIPLTGANNPSGFFYLVKVATGLLVADRIIQHTISWNALNIAKLIEGKMNNDVKVLAHMDNESLKDDVRGLLSKDRNARFSTDNSKFGNGSLRVDGTGYCSYPASDDFTLPNGTDWTIDCWYYPISKVRPYPRVWQLGDGWGGNVMTLLDRHNNNSTVFSVETYNRPTLVGKTKVIDGQWYHLAVVKSGSTLSLYVNGVLENSIQQTFDINTQSKTFNIGGVAHNDTESHANAYIDEVCFVKGKARWLTDFTPPSAPYSVAELQKIPSYFIRSLSGGIAYEHTNGSQALDARLSTGRIWPTSNEWDKYILGFPPELILPEMTLDDVFHYKQTWTHVKETPLSGTQIATNGATAALATTFRTIRGYDSHQSYWGGFGGATATSANSNLGFRPVFEYKEV